VKTVFAEASAKLQEYARLWHSYEKSGKVS